MSALGPQPITSPSARSKLIGEHNTPAGPMRVDYLMKGPSGNPELQVTLPSGAVVTVLDETTAQIYLQEAGA